MPYLWVDDPIAFASGREVYGFAKAQGWMPRLDDPRGREDARLAEPPESLALDVHGVPEYSASAEMGRRRLITIRRRGVRRGGLAEAEADTPVEGDTSLIARRLSPRRAGGTVGALVGGARSALSAALSARPCRRLEPGRRPSPS